MANGDNIPFLLLPSPVPLPPPALPHVPASTQHTFVQSVSLSLSDMRCHAMPCRGVLLRTVLSSCTTTGKLRAN